MMVTSVSDVGVDSISNESIEGARVSIIAASTECSVLHICSKSCAFSDLEIIMIADLDNVRVHRKRKPVAKVPKERRKRKESQLRKVTTTEDY